MKSIFLLLILLYTYKGGYAQTIPSFKPLRYEEDYSFLKSDTTSQKWYAALKYTSLSKNNAAYVSIGGQVRYQYFYIKNEDWGEAPKDKDGYVLTRFLAHIDVHAGKHVRTFIQLQSSMANGKADTSPVDENPLDIHQSFIDINIFPSKQAKLIFRIGRQEFSYGSQRLISVREGPNNRQSFDGVKSIVTSGNYKLDLFYSHYVASKKGILDDDFNKNVKVWGGYLVRNKITLLQNIDLYYLGLLKQRAMFEEGQAKEIRHSIGSRIWRNNGNWSYDAEGVFQFGKFGNQRIAAWTASLHTRYRFDKVKFSPEIGLKTELISGDKAYEDNKLGTFNPLFPKGAYFGLAALIGPSNLFDIHPSLSLALHRKITWDIDYDAFWRYSRNDGLYAVNVSLIYSGKNIPDKFIGQQLSTDLVYTPNDFLDFQSEFTWFKTGDFLKAAGTGKDIVFTALTAHLTF